MCVCVCVCVCVRVRVCTCVRASLKNKGVRTIPHVRTSPTQHHYQKNTKPATMLIIIHTTLTASLFGTLLLKTKDAANQCLDSEHTHVQIYMLMTFVQSPSSLHLPSPPPPPTPSPPPTLPTPNSKTPSSIQPAAYLISQHRCQSGSRGSLITGINQLLDSSDHASDSCQRFHGWRVAMWNLP